MADHAEGLLGIAGSHGYQSWRALGLVLRRTAWIGSGDLDHGVAEVERGFTVYHGLSTPPVFWSELLTIRTAGFMMARRFDDERARPNATTLLTTSAQRDPITVTPTAR